MNNRQALQILQKLLKKAEKTEFGRSYNFGDINDYPAFARQVPVHNYDDLLPYIERMKQGEGDILWPGKADKFAVSAGTTGKGKHLPLSLERLAADRAYMKKIGLSYVKQRSNPFRLFGKHLSLPGSVERHDNIQVGEVSGFSALCSPFWLRPFQLVDPARLTRLGFREKFDLLLEEALEANIKVITAVPGWILTLFQQALQKTGKQSIAEIWPKLNLLVCGGVKLSNYRPHIEKLMGGLQPDFIETYGASEGYFAFSDDLGREDLKLVTDNGIFYEFLKNPQPGSDTFSNQPAIPIWEVEKNIPYAVVVSTNAGLWRYTLRDIIEFTSLQPPRILVKGRVSEMLDDFGEALYIYEAEEALAEALEGMNLQKSSFTIIPRLPSEADTPYHHWLIQFSEPVNSETLQKLSSIIDFNIQQRNRHYATRREGGSLAAPKIGMMTQEDINGWLAANKREGAQGKLPKILRNNADLLL